MVILRGKVKTCRDYITLCLPDKLSPGERLQQSLRPNTKIGNFMEFSMSVSRRQTITVTQKFPSGIRGRNEMVKNVTDIS
jgi:hypothetical protein